MSKIHKFLLAMAILSIWIGIVILLPTISGVISYGIAGWVIGGFCYKAADFLLKREKI